MDNHGQNYYKGYEDDDIVFDWDDPDFASCSPPGQHQRSGSQRRSTGSSYSSSCFSIPEEAESDPIVMNNYALARQERTGFYARSLPVQIPLHTVRSSISASRSPLAAASASTDPPARRPRATASVAIIAAAATMRQGEVVDSHHAHHADNRCSSPSWYSTRGILTLEDIRDQYHNTQTMLTLEDLKDHYNSCFTCGVSWSEEHVSLDCFECGGYSMERPCPLCDGKCNRVWRRDISMSHAMNKAHWNGECGLPSNDQEALYLKNLVDATEDSITEALKDLKAAS